MKSLKICLILFLFTILSCESFPTDKKDSKDTEISTIPPKSKDTREGHKKRKNGPHMEVLKVNGEGKALVVIIPKDKVMN